MGNMVTSCLGKPPARRAETSSRCVMLTATTAHNFVVDNYPLLSSAIGVDKFVNSTTFSTGDHSWNIRFYPDGESRGPGYAAAFLHLVGGAAKATSVKVKFTLSLLGQDGKVVGDSKPVSIAQTFESEGVNSCWGAIKFVETTKLQDAGCFTVRCDLTVLKDAMVHKIPN